MKKLLKLTGGLAVAALFFAAATTDAKANDVSMDEVEISTVADVDDLLRDEEWEYISEHYVWRKKVTE
ncbi:hypothetical protein [Aquimarina sp. 2201CG14-23]|uniref:hypothetical protein n=1 Tax=Aquimarina mycalae TaxID=3040073 RepID=UPI00247829C2|nr:hypothetical protein [Aquimarina sp. 2201CG14-23]MDH7446088.1 hypothetical protein [Aquimarina sp. 2201CG14-23]